MSKGREQSGLPSAPRTQVRTVSSASCPTTGSLGVSSTVTDRSHAPGCTHLDGHDLQPASTRNSDLSWMIAQQHDLAMLPPRATRAVQHAASEEERHRPAAVSTRPSHLPSFLSTGHGEYPFL